MTIEEIVYLGKDNDFRLILTSDGTAVSLAAVTKIILADAGGVYDLDSESNPTFFDWTTGATGEIIFRLGAATNPAAKYTYSLYVLDPTNTNGIYWGDIKVKFVQPN